MCILATYVTVIACTRRCLAAVAATAVAQHQQQNKLSLCKTPYDVLVLLHTRAWYEFYVVHLFIYFVPFFIFSFVVCHLSPFGLSLSGAALFMVFGSKFSIKHFAATAADSIWVALTSNRAILFLSTCDVLFIIILISFFPPLSHRIFRSIFVNVYKWMNEWMGMNDINKFYR